MAEPSAGAVQTPDAAAPAPAAGAPAPAGGTTLLTQQAPPAPNSDATGAPGEPAAAPGSTPDAKPDDAASKVVAPEKYEFILPEGVTLDEAALEDFTPAFKDLGLSNEQAQKLVDLEVKRQERALQQQADAWNKQQEDWKAEVKAHPQLGGKALDQTLMNAQAAVGKFATPEARAFFEQGWGNHPALIATFAAIGNAMAEAAIHGSSAPAAPTLAQKFYKDMNP